MELFSMMFALLFMAFYAMVLLVRTYSYEIFGFQRRVLRRFIRWLPSVTARENTSDREFR